MECLAEPPIGSHCHLPFSFVLTSPMPGNGKWYAMTIICSAAARSRSARRVSPALSGTRSNTACQSGSSRCRGRSTASASCNNWLDPEEMSTAMWPGVWPGAGMAWIPDTTSVARSRSSTCCSTGGRFFYAEEIRSILIASGNCVAARSMFSEVQKSHLDFHITCDAGGWPRRQVQCCPGLEA